MTPPPPYAASAPAAVAVLLAADHDPVAEAAVAPLAALAARVCSVRPDGGRAPTAPHSARCCDRPSTVWVAGRWPRPEKVALALAAALRAATLARPPPTAPAAALVGCPHAAAAAALGAPEDNARRHTPLEETVAAAYCVYTTTFTMGRRTFCLVLAKPLLLWAPDESATCRRRGRYGHVRRATVTERVRPLARLTWVLACA